MTGGLAGRTRAREMPAGRGGRWVEVVASATLWAYLCVLITGLAASRSAGTALFLGARDAGGLGTLYMVVALAVTAMLYVFANLDLRISQERLALTTMLVVGIVATLFAIAGAGGAKRHWLFYGALYVFVETAAVVSTLQFWTLSNTLFNWPQAHRWYPMIATGGIAGSMLGGWVARQMAPHAPINMLWILVISGPVVAPAIYILSHCRDRLGLPDPRRPRSDAADTAPEQCNRPDAPPGTQSRWDTLSVNLSRVVFLTVFTTTLTDFYFKFFADEHYGGNPAGLTQFFGNYYMAVAVTTMLLQIVVTPVLLRRRSAFSGLSLMPAVLLLGTIANLASPTLFLALVLKLIDSGFSHSVYRSCRELLFTPLPIEIVGSFKTLSEGVAGRLGLLACGAVLLVAAPIVNGSLLLTSIGVCTIAWLFALRRLRLAYRNELPEIWEPARQRRRHTAAAPLDRPVVSR